MQVQKISHIIPVLMIPLIHPNTPERSQSQLRLRKFFALVANQVAKKIIVLAFGKRKHVDLNVLAMGATTKSLSQGASSIFSGP